MTAVSADAFLASDAFRCLYGGVFHGGESWYVW